MRRVRRLNGDTTWWLEWDSTALVIDPWLIGSQVDGHRWFSEQRHVEEVVPPADVASFDAVVLTQRFTDHAHAASLQALRHVHGQHPIAAVSSAMSIAGAAADQRNVHRLAAPADGWTRVGDVRLAILRPDRRLPPFFNALVIVNDERQEAVLYAPHGINLRTYDLGVLKAHDVVLLLTSFARYALPWWLGGTVTPGLTHALKLIDGVQPRAVMATHDEAKAAAGLVACLARREAVDVTDARLACVPLVRAPIGHTITVR